VSLWGFWDAGSCIKAGRKIERVRFSVVWNGLRKGEDSKEIRRSGSPLINIDMPPMSLGKPLLRNREMRGICGGGLRKGLRRFFRVYAC